MHFFYTFPIGCKQSGKVPNSPIEITKIRLGLKTLSCAQVLYPSPGLKHLLTETGNEALLIPACGKIQSI